MRLLALDTASACCSAALLDGEALIGRAVPTARDHARLILPMIDGLLAEGGLALHALDGIAFGRGPGSFTGLRIAASVTQGLAAGAGLPVYPVSDLRALAEAARAGLEVASPAGGLILAAMDARMGELYWALFAPGARPVGEAAGGERLSPPATLLDALGAGANADISPVSPIAIVAAAGMGLTAHPSIVRAAGLPDGRVHARMEPHAREIARLAAFDLAGGARWQDAATAQPVYLRDRVVHT